MEINAAVQQISIDSREILDFEEQDALSQAAPEQQDQIKAEYAARREALPPAQFSFSLAPPDFLNQAQAMEFAREHGLLTPGKKTNAYVLRALDLLFRTTAWNGFAIQGKPLDCTLENKLLVFGQAFDVIQALARKLVAREEAETKNSGTSASG